MFVKREEFKSKCKLKTFSIVPLRTFVLSVGKIFSLKLRNMNSYSNRTCIDKYENQLLEENLQMYRRLNGYSENKIHQLVHVSYPTC